jgi:hypothetical protein
VIVAESNQVTIYDGDDPDMPMWMVFDATSFDVAIGGGSGSTISCTSSLNGRVLVGAANYDIHGIDFVGDRVARNSGSTHSFNGNIKERNNNKSWSSGGSWFIDGNIVNRYVNDVAMTVLPNAPIDADTELPVPTIAVATNGGVSVIKDDGTVVDITASAGSSYNGASFIDIDDNYNLIFEQDNVGRSLFYIPIPNTDRTTQTSDNSRTDKRMLPASSSGSGTNAIPRFSGSNASIAIAGKQDDQYVYGGTGLTAYSFGGTKLQSSVAYITSDHNTGHMVGDIKLATLSDTSTTNVTGGTQPDRSYNNNALTVNGTITKTAVATGADLVAYSGFSSSNYLEQPYNSDLDFNSGDFAYCFWTNNAHSDSEYIADRAEGNGDYRIALYMSSVSNGTMNFYTRDTAATEVTAIIGTPNEWAQVWVIRRGTSHEIWVNGVNGVATTATVRDVSYASGNAVQRIGTRFNGDGPNTGKIALLRISATAPSAEQIKKIYNDEKFLFQENTKATLYGSSDAVTALAYDDDTELLHVGTSAGRSEFQGLRRINNTTDAVGSAMSASNGLVVED